tara:strand:+ start:1640 stop:2050 length:411 start_codon:yes stop_codon:yes gene_type:complete
MNINKAFKFEKRSRNASDEWFSMRESFCVFHRDSGDCVADVSFMFATADQGRRLHEAGTDGFWQAQRNGKVFNARTRAEAVRGLVNRDLPLLVIKDFHQALKAQGAYNIQWRALELGIDEFTSADPAVMGLAPRKS